MNIKLNIPPESSTLRTEVTHIRELMSGPGVEWDPLAVWYGNKIPKYLWAQWKDELKPSGFTWQKFLKLLRYRTDGAVLWFYGRLPWRDFVQQTIDLVNGPLGKQISQK